MDKAVDIYGRKSYEFAVGRINANAHRPFSAEQWNRLQEADLWSAEKIVVEYGYPSIREGETIFDSIEAGLKRTIEFIRDIAPDAELVNLLFFEEDAVNLKLFLKARLLGTEPASLPVCVGGINSELLRICVYTEDFSLLGETAQAILSDICTETDPRKISCLADNAMFCRALALAEKKHCVPLVHLMTEYGVGRNRRTALRLAALGADPQKYTDAFFPLEWESFRAADHEKTKADVLKDINKRLAAVTEEIGYDSGMGAIAQYYFMKKNEAAALRMLFTEKSFAAAGGAAENG
ncbi:MAG: V-type ATPase subunit [Clostridiales bacterium]|jgi:H+transporting two-sector ATPase C (AC39) subunit|nr:V-type ATPase subunit [Clostridiales bacterium]